MPNDEFTPEFFDTASAAWMENKTKKANCTYVYKCNYIHMNGQVCGKKAVANLHMMCHQHRGKGLAIKENNH